MSYLQLHGRPYVVFNPEDKEHRKWFAEFNRTFKWGKCPFRFLVNDDHGDLITQIQRALIRYYVKQEFGRVASKQQVKKNGRTRTTTG